MKKTRYNRSMRLGIFGGSFDPIHLEHRRLCLSAIESLKLDKLFVVPAFAPPHKKGKILSSDADRLALCRLAFEDEKRIEVSDFEIRKKGTSYTYLTVRAFKEKYPTDELFFLVGTDMLRDFPTWKNPEDILKNAKLGVCAREEGEDWEQREKEAFFRRFSDMFETISYRGGKVSSTRIRVLAAAGEDISFWTGKKVSDYILSKGMYELNGAKEALSLQKESRKQHSLRVAFFAAENAAKCGVDEKKAVCAALFHDCAKNLPLNSPYLVGFEPPPEVPSAVLHQYAGAYLAEKRFGVTDEDVLNAVRYHTSGRANASALEKLVFIADMSEEGRTYPEAEELRTAFFQNGLDACYLLALKRTLEHLEKKGEAIYPLTRFAYEYAKKETKSWQK